MLIPFLLKGLKQTEFIRKTSELIGITSMKSNMTKLGTSLKVPSVHELAKQKITSVPPQYLRPDQDPPFISNADSSQEIPVIDMQKLLSGDDLMNAELEKLHFACKEWGFFQLVNHGVSSSLVEKLKLEIREFFNLPIEEKKRFWQQPGDIEGFGQLFVVSEGQKLDWADLFYMLTLPTHLRKPHLFPKLPDQFREALEAYSAALKNLAMKIFNQLAKALGMKHEEMNMLFEDGMQDMRMNYYPPCPQPELVIGLGPHSDATGLTILLQINEVVGLQIKRGGAWIPVLPLPNAFVVNVGDFLEIVSNGTYKSVEHRATVNSQAERLSVATFHAPKLDGELGPAPSLITPEFPPRFKTIYVRDYFKGYFSRRLLGKSYIDAMRILSE